MKLNPNTFSENLLLNLKCKLSNCLRSNINTCCLSYRDGSQTLTHTQCTMLKNHKHKAKQKSGNGVSGRRPMKRKRWTKGPVTEWNGEAKT